MVGLCARKMSHSGAEGDLTRPSGKRRSLSHSMDHMSLVMVHHVPSNIPQSALPARLFIFEDNEAVTREVIKCRSRNWRHVPRTFET